jgi:phenylacetate-CoA ligase
MFDPKALYYAAPYPLKALAAAARGARLNQWRYGAATEQLVAKAHELERQTPARLLELQQQSLIRLLERATASVPHYRALSANPRSLADWPILDKAQLRADPKSFLAEDCDPGKMFSLHTSGSTGTPLHLWISQTNLERWYALFEARWRQWHGVDRSDRWAILGGQLVAHPTRRKPPYWVWNRSMRQLYLSSYHISDDSTRDYVAALKHHDVRYLLGYPSAMYDLARRALGLGIDGPRLDVVLSNAEPLFPHQREAISQLFGCPVRDTYGMAEMVCGAGECEHGTLHLWSDAGILEVVDDDGRALPPGETGRLVCTGLINHDMPLIRYQVGDRGALASAGQTCDCGRTLPIVGQIEGRLDDLVLTRDGRTIGRLDTVFKADLPIQAAQIIQESLDELRVLVVANDDLEDFAATARDIEHRLQERVGAMKIAVESVASIPRGANGKFRAVLSRLAEHDAPTTTTRAVAS